MPQEFGLSRPTLLKGTGQLNVLYRGFATEDYCWLGRGKHETRKGHELRSGTAYFIETPEDGIKQFGPTCAARVGKQKLHTVPDLTREAVSAHEDEEPGHIRSGPLVAPPARFNEKTFEEVERAKDIEYLMLRGEILPGIKARERSWRKLKPLKSDVRDKPLIDLLQEYKKDPTIALGEVRRIRDYAEHGDPVNDFTRLHRCYVAHAGIQLCLKSRRITIAQSHQLRQWDQTLAETRTLDAGSVQSLNTIIRQVSPHMPTSKVEGLGAIVLQQSIFDGVALHDGPGRSKLHFLERCQPEAAKPAQQRLFG